MLLFEVILVATVAILPALETGAVPTPSGIDWLRKKEEFYKSTTFQLSEANLRLLGGKYSQHRIGHLPFWFDYKLYKTVFNKRYANPDEDRARHSVYIKRCVRILKKRVLYRILAGSEDAVIDGNSDQVSTTWMPSFLCSNIFLIESCKFTTTKLNHIAQNKLLEDKKIQLNHGFNANQPDGIGFSVSFIPDELLTGQNETPLEKGIRLVREELDRVESRNQLENYLKAFNVSIRECLVFEANNETR